MLTEEPRIEPQAPAASPSSTRPLPAPLQPGVELPRDGLRYRIKNKLLGPPLHTEQLDHERLGKPTALAVFASDNLSSSAYATEEILRVLIPVVGVGAFLLVVPLTWAMIVVLGFLILSYRQTIKAYPTAGGAYMVTRDNFGLLPAQVAGVALLTDYVLTVSVSVAAGTATSASTFSVFAGLAERARKSWSIERGCDDSLGDFTAGARNIPCGRGPEDPSSTRKFQSSGSGRRHRSRRACRKLRIGFAVRLQWRRRSA